MSLPRPCCQLEGTSLPRGRRAGHSLVPALQPRPRRGSAAQRRRGQAGSQHGLQLRGGSRSWTGAPETACSLFSLTFCLGEAGPIPPARSPPPLAPGRASPPLGLPPNPVSPWLHFLPLERRALCTDVLLGADPPYTGPERGAAQRHMFRRESSISSPFPLMLPI